MEIVNSSTIDFLPILAVAITGITLISFLLIICICRRKHQVMPAKDEEAALEHPQLQSSTPFVQEEQPRSIGEQEQPYKIIKYLEREISMPLPHEHQLEVQNKQVQQVYLNSRNEQIQQAHLNSRNELAQQAHLNSRNGQVQQQDFTDQGWQKEDIHEFVDKIVRLFSFQRIRGYQFAVVVLLPNREITSSFTLRTKTGVVTHPNEITNRDTPTFPPDNELGNFITARPDQHIIQRHAEVFLTRRISSLMKSCEQQMLQCQTIVLYTWLFPCNDCKNAIIQTLQKYAKKYRVIVIYTSKMKNMDKSEVSKITSELRGAQIDVKQENYGRRLKFLQPC